LRQPAAVGPWLFGVAHRLALRARQEGRRRREREARVEERPSGDPLAELTVREAHALLDEELVRLPKRDRGPLVLCYLEGLTREEAAQQLGCPLGTLKSRLERARAVLHKRLARRGLTLTGVLSTLLLSRMPALAMPVGLSAATVKAATASAGGSAAQGLVRPQAAAWAEAALTSLRAGKLKVAAALLLATVAGTLGLGFSASWFGAPETIEEKPDAAVAQKDAGQPPPSKPPAPERTARGNPPKQPVPKAEVAAPVPPPRDEIPAQRLTGWEPHARLLGHQGGVRSLAFTADGTRLVSGGDDGHVRVWDVATKKELLSLHRLKARPIRAVALGAQDTVAVGNDDGTVLVYDLRGEQEPQVVHANRGRDVLALTFGGDHRSLAWARSDGAVEGDRNRAGPLPALAGQEGYVTCVAFSPDGRRVVWGTKDGRVKLWDAATGKEVGHYAIHKHQVWCVLFSGDGWTVASVDHFGAVVLWDAGTGKEQALLQNPCRGGHVHVLALAISPDGSLVATGGGGDHTIRVWETRSGRQLAHLIEHQGPIFGLAFSPDGRFLASASGDGTIRLWTPTRPLTTDGPGAN
jgi:hypothetical protein